jgi:glycine hydroxymethyltransferase
LAIFYALVPFGEKIMGMGLDMGGHLSHGQKVSITGKLWKQVRFNLSPKTELLDYDSIKKIALKEKPKLVIAGFTAYPRIINFKKFREICDKINAIFMVDMSHFAGLVAGRVYPSPFPFAHVVMTTTHKTLRGPRGAIIFARKIDLNFFRKDISQDISIFEAINKAIFPGIQGGPHLNNIAAIGVALNEARKSSFRKYASMVVKNARVLAREFKNLKWRVISGGTDTHLILLDVSLLGLSGGEAQRILENHGIIVNKNMIPFDSRKPTDPSGIRIGTAFVTSAGKKERDMIKIARLIDGILRKKNDNRRRKNS